MYRLLSRDFSWSIFPKTPARAVVVDLETVYILGC